MGLRPIAVIDYDSDNTPRIYTIHTDHLGTPQYLTNANQEVVWQGEYDAFGNVTVTALPHRSKEMQAKRQDLSFSLFNRAYAVDNVKREPFEFNLRFAGQYEDDESGYYYNWHRYYDPKTGRYLTSDPIGLNGGLNTYGYAGQNPVQAVDPWGLAVVNITMIQDYEVIEAEGVWKYIPFGNNPEVKYLDSYQIDSITFDPNSSGVKVINKVPIIYAHNRNSCYYINFIGTGKDFDNLTWEKEQSLSDVFTDGFNNGIGVGLGNASLGRIRQISQSSALNSILLKPSLIKGLNINQAKTIFRGTRGWEETVMTRSTRAEGWVLREMKNGQPTGRRIQYHPGTPRHYNGKPYWKISSGEGGTVRYEAK
ncbi:RHS repeat domain-containing protein [Psychrobacter lutiphocae]|uniref:RHS repeat domain-containing protein n=1 Tax=Psychrobacter lutiphocae TaxID=540500 RepID=UPI00036BF081|nr:RHS repeat-associated core domain-containing protein [Psychrobacter lutiphocae]